MLSGIFPRHIIEFLSFESLISLGHVEERAEQMGQLARTHQNITILFMDIVGGSFSYPSYLSSFTLAYVVCLNTYL